MGGNVDTNAQVTTETATVHKQMHSQTYREKRQYSVGKHLKIYQRHCMMQYLNYERCEKKQSGSHKNKHNS